MTTRREREAAEAEANTASAARYTVREQGGMFIVVDEQTGGQVGTSGSQEGADQLAADFEQRHAWATETGTDNPTPIDPNETPPVEPALLTEEQAQPTQ